MTTRRDALKTLAMTGIAISIAPIPNAFAATTSLTWKHFPAGEHGFFRAPVLLMGKHDAILIDAGFTFADGKALVEAIQATGKKLTTIYISQSDPDYYFSLAPIKAAFPSARVIAATATVDAIKASIEKKLAVWGPQLKENGPRILAEVVIPEVFDGHALSLEDNTIEVVDTDGLTNRRYLWVPALNAICGGVLVFSGVHVWTADTANAKARAAWVKTLDAMAARKPAAVIPGHLAPGAAIDVSAIAYTRSYLLAFEEELAKSKNSDELIAAMTKRYPDAGMGIALQIGAKVALGEMKWG